MRPGAASREAQRLIATIVCTIASGLIGHPVNAQGVVPNPATAIELPSVEVVGTTPLPGLTTPLRDVPGQVHSMTDAEIERDRPSSLSEHLERATSGVSIGQGQGNAHQPELVFRGFTASPLLGSPQGLSIYLDGVRINEAFGDAVNWDLIPANAISSAHLLSGSNPLFGLNTLGGALTLHTKSGFSYPGQSAQLIGGAWGRRGLQAQSGGHGERSDYFMAMNALDEDGWRSHSSSRLRQFFGKTGWQDDKTDVDLSIVLADNTLQGTQALPLSMLGDRRQPYSYPDRTDNSALLVTLRGSRYLSASILGSVNLYARSFAQDNLSSNVNDAFDPLAGVGPGNSTGFLDRSKVREHMVGASVQLTSDFKMMDRLNRLTIGAALDQGRSLYEQDEAEAAFTSDRNTIGTQPFDAVTRAKTVNTYHGLYATNNIQATERLSAVVSGRYNIAQVRIRDASGASAGLDGDHTFKRFNPAIGLAFNPDRRATYYVNYNEGMRAPSPMELTCADPTAPCRLPISFLADPPLKPVVAKTIEAGLRTKPAANTGVTLNVFRTVLNDDIQFVSSGGAINAGFFQNIGRSQRTGFDLGGSWSPGPLKLTLGFSRINARYDSSFTVRSSNNSSADANGDIQVGPGNRIPGIPFYSVKLRAEYALTSQWSMAVVVNQFGEQVARGDENNEDANGRLPAYRVVHLSSGYAITQRWDLILKVDNVFNRKYESIGVLGENFFNGPGRTFDANAVAAEQFRAPGAPRAGWIAVRYAFDGKLKR